MPFGSTFCKRCPADIQRNSLISFVLVLSFYVSVSRVDVPSAMFWRCPLDLAGTSYGMSCTVLLCAGWVGQWMCCLGWVLWTSGGHSLWGTLWMFYKCPENSWPGAKLSLQASAGLLQSDCVWTLFFFLDIWSTFRTPLSIDPLVSVNRWVLMNMVVVGMYMFSL